MGSQCEIFEENEEKWADDIAWSINAGTNRVKTIQCIFHISGSMRIGFIVG